MNCPRCKGFMFDANKRYWPYEFVYKNMKHCAICGRNWQIEEGQVVEFPKKER